MACLEPLANPSLNPHVRRQSVVAHLWHERSSNEIACTILQSAIELQHKLLCFDGNGLRREDRTWASMAWRHLVTAPNLCAVVDCKSFIINKPSWKLLKSGDGIWFTGLQSNARESFKYQVR